MSPVSFGSSQEVVTLPISCLYLHTCFFRIHHGSTLGDDEKKFAAVTWEIFNILKENFPSKISLR